MVKLFKVLPALAAVFALSSSASALDNDDKTISKVDVAGSSLVLWISEPLANKVASCSATVYNGVSCSLSTVWCQKMLSVALAAQLSGRKVDIEADTTCNAGFTAVSRLRMQ